MEKIPSPFATDYVSPPVAAGWLRRTFPSLSFYPSLFGIVWRASRKARRGRYTDEEWVKSSIEVMRLVLAHGVAVRVENLAPFAGLDGPAVVVGNHMSTLETFLLPGMLRPHRPMTFVVKRQLIEAPVFGHVMRSRNPVVVGRASAREDLRTMLEEGEARLRAGISLVVFPQTTRSAAWNPGEFNSIGVKLARHAGVPVVPLALRSDFWGVGRLVRDVGPIRPELPVRLAFGAPIAVTGNGREAQEAVVRFIADHADAWGIQTVPAPPRHASVA